MHPQKVILVIMLETIRDLLILIVMTNVMYIRAMYRYFIPPPPKSLVGKKILITGSAGGIGREICLQLSTSGATLLCWDVDKQANDKFVKELIKTGVKAYSYQVDVTARSQVIATIEKVQRELGEIEIIINNAGIMPCKPFLEQKPEELEKTFQVNVFAHFWILQEILPGMVERNEGHIVTVCSAAGLIGTRNLAPYSGSKHAVHGFIEALKEEIRHDPRKPKINFTTVYPFACSTGLMSGINSYSRFPFLVKQVLQPDEVAIKIVDGLLRNYEHVYIPGFVSFAGRTAKSLLPEVQRLSSDFMNCFVEPARHTNLIPNKKLQ